MLYKLQIVRPLLPVSEKYSLSCTSYDRKRWHHISQVIKISCEGYIENFAKSMIQQRKHGIILR